MFLALPAFRTWKVAFIRRVVAGGIDAVPRGGPGVIARRYPSAQRATAER